VANDVGPEPAAVDLPRRAQDVRLGEMLRALRREQGLTQEQLANAAELSRRTIGRIEHGLARDLTLHAIRAAFEACDARLYLNPWWNGAALDRLLDRRHAGLVERATGVLRQLGWPTQIEVTFNEYGDRGSIDILGGHEPTLSALVGEVKSAIGSIEELNRKLDVKVRLAPEIVEQRFGWRPTSVSRLLILPEDSTARRVLARHDETFRAVYPQRGAEVRRWLRKPSGAISGLWFLTEVDRSPRS
jgi:transcriptional regulator with XRE-family HTH domain